MSKSSLIEGPASELIATPTTQPSGSHKFDGEAGYKKRTGGTRFHEVNRDVNSRYPQPTKK